MHDNYSPFGVDRILRIVARSLLALHPQRAFYPARSHDRQWFVAVNARSRASKTRTLEHGVWTGMGLQNRRRFYGRERSHPEKCIHSEGAHRLTSPQAASVSSNARLIAWIEGFK